MAGPADTEKGIKVVKTTCPHCTVPTLLARGRYFEAACRYALIQNPTTKLWEQRVVYPPHLCVVVDALDP